MYKIDENSNIKPEGRFKISKISYESGIKMVSFDYITEEFSAKATKEVNTAPSPKKDIKTNKNNMLEINKP